MPTINSVITRLKPPFTDEQWEQLHTVLDNDELIVLPTDTVYGIGAKPLRSVAIDRLLTAKGRGRDFPSPVLIGNLEQLDQLVEYVPHVARILMEHLWPGALTLVLPASSDLGWDLGQTHGTVAVRMPDHEYVRTILTHCGPLAVTSANLHGQPPARNIAQAEQYFHNVVSLYIDTGHQACQSPSTIVRCIEREDATYLSVLRQGDISESVLRDIVLLQTHSTSATRIIWE